MGFPCPFLNVVFDYNIPSKMLCQIDSFSLGIISGQATYMYFSSVCYILFCGHVGPHTGKLHYLSMALVQDSKPHMHL